MAEHDGSLLIFLIFNFLLLSYGHECQRLCDSKQIPKICKYKFSIGLSQRKSKNVDNVAFPTNKLFLSINNQWPPPMIKVCQNDTILVDVKNDLPYGIETSIHWYGFTAGNSPFMDGVPMITQCPIYTRTTFQYRMKAINSGSFYYRAHSVSQQLDGIFGPLIVENENDQKYDGKVVVVSPKMKKIHTYNNNYEENLKIDSLLFEVYNITNRYDNYDDDDNNKIHLPLKIRVINAAALNCPVTLYTHTVPLKVVAFDGNNIKPHFLNNVTINPGERIDLVIKREAIKVIYIMGHNLCEGHIKYVLDKGKSDNNKCYEKKQNIPFMENPWDKFKPENSENLEKSDLDVYIPYDVTIIKNFSGIVDFRYKLGDLTPYAPSMLSKQNVDLYQINYKSFMYPSSPILSQPNDVPEDIICTLEKPSVRCLQFNNDFCECLGIINLPYNKNIDLYLIDEGKNGNFSQTVHVHGHTFNVLSIKSYDRSINLKKIKNDEKIGKINKNLVDPIKKDTISVPNKGFVVLRLKTNNPGFWLIESVTSKANYNLGFEILLNVENPKEDLKPPKNFPKCGTMKNPDLVIIPD